MDLVINFLKSICRTIGGWLGLPTLTVGIIGLCVIAVLILVIICESVSHSKKKKRAAAQKQAQANSAERKEISAEQPTVEEIQNPSSAVEQTETIEQAETLGEVANKEQAEPIVESPQEPVGETESPAKENVAEVETSVDEKPAESEPKPARSAPAKKTTAAKKPAAKSKTSGKWVIEIRKENEYTAKLLASNGEVLLNSETYSTVEGVKSGIDTILKGIVNGNFVIYNTKGGDFYFKLKSAGNKLLCVGEIYTSREGCYAAMESVRRFAKTAIISEKIEEGDRYIEYQPVNTEYEVKRGVRGKWKIETGETGGVCARLYANNGQLMLSTEEVKEKKTAMRAIENVKKNSAEGNFVIEKDKFGRFYYKLRNANKSVICVGEGYDTLESCISALESVRRFAAIAVMPGEGAATAKG